MSKVVLIMDEPDGCDSCPVSYLDDCDNYYCTPLGCTVYDDFGEGREKPDYCPLKPLPSPKEPIYKYESGREKYTDFARGWNACLEAIGGRSNE